MSYEKSVSVSTLTIFDHKYTNKYIQTFNHMEPTFRGEWEECAK